MSGIDISKYLNNYVESSINLSEKHCIKGFTDQNNCEWYHKSWVVLRCLDMVSNPFWHESFYRKSLSPLREQKILILGTADFSTPLLVSKIGFDDIFITDLCNTPLKLCQLLTSQKGLNWKTVDLSDVYKNYANYFEVVTNDAFLTRFKNRNEKLLILKKIKKLLVKGGSYITTVRFSSQESQIIKANSSEIKSFVDKAVQRNSPFEKQIIDDETLKNLAEDYISKITSYPIGSIHELKKLFKDGDFKIIDLKIYSTPGEIERTTYFQIHSISL